MATSGVDFPLDKDGKRSSTSVNQGAIAAAVERQCHETHKAASSERKWRFGYAKHILRQVQLAATSEEKALGIARDGLGYLHSKMEFVRDGESKPLADAMDKFRDKSFETYTVKGTGSLGPGLEVPYDGRVLCGDDIQAQAETWVRKGVIELDTGDALRLVAGNPQWLDLSDKTFVLFGAGSAMGPFPLLMGLGAHVIALDLDKPQIWKRLLSIARASPGRLTMPTRKAVPEGASDEEVAGVAGCNLLEQTPEVRNWLLGLEPDKCLVLGAYCYLDGPLFVRVSMAMDAIIADLVERRSIKPSLAYLCTPTDVHLCTPTARDAAIDNLRKAPSWQRLCAVVLGFTKMRMAPNRVKGALDALPICDALVVEQGPNYCLAKRLQHWRAALSRSQGCVVSSNIAPSTATASVISNKSFALAYKGMHYFRPMEVFQPETSNAVMTALLVNDLRNPQSAANPETPLKNPMQLFAATAFHGGAWRTGYKFGNIGPPSVVGHLTVAYIVKAYLIAYSVAQCLGWFKALLSLDAEAILGNDKGVSCWSVSGTIISSLTLYQSAEVVHAAFGLVRSNPAMTAVQILSRNALCQVMNCGTAASSAAAAGPWVPLLVLCWSITEVIRYAYYALNELGIHVGPLTWLRYSSFIVLYPAGVSGEMGCVYHAMPVMDGIQHATTDACDLSGRCGVLAKALYKSGFPAVLVVWMGGLYFLYSSMCAQRRKKLGDSRNGGSQKKKS